MTTQTSAVALDLLENGIRQRECSRNYQREWPLTEFSDTPGPMSWPRSLSIARRHTFEPWLRLLELGSQAEQGRFVAKPRHKLHPDR